MTIHRLIQAHERQASAPPPPATSTTASGGAGDLPELHLDVGGQGSSAASDVRDGEVEEEDDDV